jgi:hypothetical protein
VARGARHERSAPPPCRQAALPRRKIIFPLREKNRRAQKQKNDKAISLLGSALNRAGRRGFASARGQKSFPSNSPNFCPLVKIAVGLDKKNP